MGDGRATPGATGVRPGGRELATRLHRRKYDRWGEGAFWLDHLGNLKSFTEAIFLGRRIRAFYIPDDIVEVVAAMTEGRSGC